MNPIKGVIRPQTQYMEKYIFFLDSYSKNKELIKILELGLSSDLYHKFKTHFLKKIIKKDDHKVYFQSNLFEFSFFLRINFLIRIIIF